MNRNDILRYRRMRRTGRLPTVSVPLRRMTTAELIAESGAELTAAWEWVASAQDILDVTRDGIALPQQRRGGSR